MITEHNSVNKVKRTQFFFDCFDHYQKTKQILLPQDFSIPRIYLKFIEKHLGRLKSFTDSDKNDYVLAVKKEVEIFITSREDVKANSYFDKIS
jgi:hypothetical protein